MPIKTTHKIVGTSATIPQIDPPIAIPFPPSAPLDFSICDIAIAPDGMETADKTNDSGAAMKTRKQQTQLPMPQTSAPIPVTSAAIASGLVRCDGGPMGLMGGVPIGGGAP